MPATHQRHRRRLASVTLIALAMALAGGGLLPASGGATRGHGDVKVLYAGSLENVINTTIAPAFNRATGYTLSGYPAGSKDLAAEIKGKVRQGDVFISASSKVDASLEGAGNGAWVSWYAPFGTSTLVLGYNRHSGFASQLRSKPWYEVIAEPGFHLGFTDPKLDPKGELTVAALDAAAARYHVPALKALAADQADVYPEQDLVGRLEAGQLDAGFFYTVEATAAKLPTVSLAPIAERAQYTITILNRAPDGAGAIAFVRFLLGARGQALLHSAGLTLIATPRAAGSGVPAGLAAVIRGGG